jgi:hypothetical protein
MHFARRDIVLAARNDKTLPALTFHLHAKACHQVEGDFDIGFEISSPTTSMVAVSPVSGSAIRGRSETGWRHCP